MVLQVLAFKLQLKWQKVKIWPLPMRSNVLGVIERTTLKPKERDHAHASSARVALAAITSPTAPWVFRTVTCAQAHFLQSRTHRHALERTNLRSSAPLTWQHIKIAYKYNLL